MFRKIFLFFTLALCTSVFSQNYIPYSDEEIELLASREMQGHKNPQEAVITSTSTVNWTKKLFSSDVSLNVVKAGIPMPSGKASSINKIQMELPVLVKDPLLSLYVDDTYTLGDLVLEGTVTLEELTRIIDNSNQTPAVFESFSDNLRTRHTITLEKIGALLVKHKKTYTQKRPVDAVSSRTYSGIVIDARGTLDVHGEFVESPAYPCLFPKIWADDMTLVYEKNMVEADIAKNSGIVKYSSSDYTEDFSDRAGNDPLWITAKKVYGINRTDPVISYKDYLKITSKKENLELLRQGKIVILLDEDHLVHKVSVPDKNKNYYIAYHKIQRYFFENKVPDVTLIDTDHGLRLTVENLNFIADSPELLPEELPRINQIAESLIKFTKTGEFSILVEGHTADVNKPNGQMELSIERAKSIINLLVENGMDPNIFNYKGYGGTKPRADNSTPEGRAQNRRVEITVIPRSTTVMSN
ncbi:MAG: OmpA family protein [Treponema sp.]|nr:OmpA family protein [Spirochaetia bacterium]MDY4902367.1 OmpA family protein [Treponema sp.]